MVFRGIVYSCEFVRSLGWLFARATPPQVPDAAAAAATAAAATAAAAVVAAAAGAAAAAAAADMPASNGRGGWR
eukprot:scaffold1343_cov369-Prasinococcus_capsulatus_cf.AAC.7